MKRVRTSNVPLQTLWGAFETTVRKRERSQKTYPPALSEKEIGKIKRDWGHGDFFIFDGELYEMRNDIDERIWSGKNKFNKTSVQAKKRDCIFIDKNDAILKLYIVLSERLKHITSAEYNVIDLAIFEVKNMLKYCMKIILETYKN